MEPHHHQVVAFAGTLVTNDRQMRKHTRIQLPQIHCALLVAPLQVLQGCYPPIPLDDEEPFRLDGPNQNGINIEPAVGLHAGDEVPDILLVASQHEAGRPPLHFSIQDALWRYEPMVRMVHEPDVVRVEEEPGERYGLPLSAHRLRSVVCHGSVSVG